MQGHRFEGEETPNPVTTAPFSVSNMIEKIHTNSLPLSPSLALTMGRFSSMANICHLGKKRFGVGCTRPRFVIVPSSFCRFFSFFRCIVKVPMILSRGVEKVERCVYRNKRERERKSWLEDVWREWRECIGRCIRGWSIRGILIGGRRGSFKCRCLKFW